MVILLRQTYNKPLAAEPVRLLNRYKGEVKLGIESFARCRFGRWTPSVFRQIFSVLYAARNECIAPGASVTTLPAAFALSTQTMPR